MGPTPQPASRSWRHPPIDPNDRCLLFGLPFSDFPTLASQLLSGPVLHQVDVYLRDCAPSEWLAITAGEARWIAGPHDHRGLPCHPEHFGFGKRYAGPARSGLQPSVITVISSSKRGGSTGIRRGQQPVQTALYQLPPPHQVVDLSEQLRPSFPEVPSVATLVGFQGLDHRSYSDRSGAKACNLIQNRVGPLNPSWQLNRAQDHRVGRNWDKIALYTAMRYLPRIAGCPCL